MDGSKVEGDVGTRVIHVEGLIMEDTAGGEPIPKIMQSAGFEEQLRDIDEAIEIGEKITEKITGLDSVPIEKTEQKAGSKNSFTTDLPRGKGNISIVVE